MTAYEERCAREDELDRLTAIRDAARAGNKPWKPLLPDCPPHLLFLCEKQEDGQSSDHEGPVA